MSALRLKSILVLSVAIGSVQAWSTGSTVAIAVAEVPTPESRPVLLGADEVLASAFTQFECTGYCVACQGGPGHTASATPPSCPECELQDAKEGGGWRTLCDGRDDCSNHTCSGDGFDFASVSNSEVVNALGSALLDRSPSSLTELLTQYPTRVELSVERSAVQVFACDGEVIAHYPVSNELLSVTISTLRTL